MTIAKDFVAKALVAFVALAMIFTTYTPAAQAQSAEDLQAMINQLLAQITSLQSQVGQGSATASGYTWTRDLSQGSTGADVRELQKFLNSDPDTRVAATGVGSAGMETEYYGPATAAAVSKFQVKYRADILSPSGLVNPTGYFGPSSRAKANAQNTPVVVIPVDPNDGNDDDNNGGSTPGLSSSEAELKSFNLRAGDYTEVEEGRADVAVAEVEFDVEDGDARVDRLDVWFDRSQVTGSADEDPWRVFREVSIWVDGEKVASKRVDSRNDWSRNVATDRDRIRFTGLDIVYREDDRAEIIIAVTSQTSVQDPVNAKWQVIVPDYGIRARDGAGIDQTIGDTAQNVQFTIARDGKDDEVRVRKASSDPAATVLELEDDKTSNYLTVFAFELDTRDSTSDIEINKLTLNAQVSSSTLKDLASDIRLRADGRTYSRSSTTANVVDFNFNDGELVIDRGGRVVVEVLVRFNALKPGDAGTTLSMSLNSNGITAEGARTLQSNDISGGATGETHTLITEGLRFVKKSLTSTRIPGSGNNPVDSAEFTLVVDVTAVGEQFFIEDDAAAFAATVLRNGTTTGVSGASTTKTMTSNANKEQNRFRIDEGQTRTFTLKVTYRPSGDAMNFRTQFNSLTFYDAPAAGTSKTQTFTPVSEYRSDDVTIIN